MKPNEIKSLMILKGIKQRHVAKKLGVQQPAISGAISGDRPSRRIQHALAEELGTDYETLWGKAA